MSSSTLKRAEAGIPVDGAAAAHSPGRKLFFQALLPLSDPLRHDLASQDDCGLQGAHCQKRQVSIHVEPRGSATVQQLL